MQHALLEPIFKHKMDNKVTRNSQHCFTKAKLHLTNLTASFNDMTTCVAKGKAMGFMESNLTQHCLEAEKHRVEE